MSYDLEVYTTAAPTYKGKLLSDVVCNTPHFRLVAGGGWQIAIHGPDRVLEEDLPAGVASVLPGLTFLTVINVEGVAPPATIQLAGKIATEIARESIGVIVDQQQGTLRTPRGLRRLKVGRTSEGKALPVWLSWHFLDVDRFRKEGFDELVDLMERHFPELLPRRYGLYEPPQYEWSSDRRGEFVAFARNANFEVVWYPFKPFLHVGMGIPVPVGAERRGFRTGYVHVEVNGAVIDDVGWKRQLVRFFVQACHILQVFYGEIRQGRPLPASWWWYGIPKSRGLATAIGPPYVELWPEFSAIGTPGPKGMVIADTLGGDALLDRQDVPSVPGDIAQPDDPNIVEIDPSTGAVLRYTISGIARGYSKRWPFDGPTA